MATLKDFREAADSLGGDTKVILVNSDGDEVTFTLAGYNDDDEAFVISIDEIDVPAPAPAAPTEVITVTVPQGVEVRVERE